MSASRKTRKKTQQQNAPPQSGVSKRELALERERSHILVKGMDSLASVLKYATKWGSLTLIAWFAKEAIIALAGEDTKVAFVGIVEGLGDAVTIAPWSVSVVLAGGWFQERRARRKHVVASSSHIAMLESQIDPDRSSSKLTVIGETRKEDHD